MRSAVGRVALLLFASGFCALVYQTAWLRMFRLVFGASTAASAAVLAIFMAGLGFGGLLLGPAGGPPPVAALPLRGAGGGDRGHRGALALLLALVEWLYMPMGGSARLGLAGSSVVRLAAVAAGARAAHLPHGRHPAGGGAGGGEARPTSAAGRWACSTPSTPWARCSAPC